MKKLSAILLALILSALGFAQGNVYNITESSAVVSKIGAGQEDAQTKDMFLSYAADYKKKKKRRGRPGAKVRVELQRNGVTKFVPVSTTFQAGDRVKFHFAVNFPAHVSVLNLGSSGRFSLLFPYQGAPEVVGITQNFTVPHRNDLWFEFDNKPGTERLTFVFSSAPLISSGGSDSTTIAGSDQQSALDDLNSRALGNSKDLNLVQVSSEEGYLLCDEERLRKPVGFQITLRHR